MAAAGLTGGLIAVGAVIVAALLMRAASGGRREQGSITVPPAPEPEPRPKPADADALIDEDQDGVDDRLVVAVSSDGRAFVPDLHVVHLLPPEEEGEEWKVGSRLKRVQAAMARSATSWHPGDLSGVRVVRGEFEEGPWLLEALGREGEYLTFPFEAKEAAEAARELFERMNIVRLGVDENGRPMPPSAEQFAEARRIMEETAAQLELPDDFRGPDEGEGRREGTP